MMQLRTKLLVGCWALGGAMLVTGADKAADKPLTEPRPIPLTRPEMKQLLEDMKQRKNRIPLPELTPEQREQLGERADNYETRLRFHYSPGGDQRGGGRDTGGGNNRGNRGTGERPTPQGAGGTSFVGGEFSREPDPKMTLDYPFKTKMFWIVSRTNNCQYCLGHQEIKLSLAGILEDELAALDSDWSQFTPAEQAAFKFARKITYEPHRLNDADIADLKQHYTDLQILEIIFSVSGNNSINRWKEGAGIPQEQTAENFVRRSENVPTDRPLPTKSFLTPTSEKYQKSLTTVAAVTVDDKTGAPTRKTICDRPDLESREETEAALAAAKKRTPRLPLVADAEARALLPEDWAAGPLPNWVRLMANFPRDGRSRIISTQSAITRDELPALLKAQISWIVARQDRAWYAAGQAKQRLLDLGQTLDQIYALDDLSWKSFSESDRSLFRVARQLAATPIVLTDEEVAQAVAAAGPRDVVRVITYTTGCASFDRVTESAGLPLE